MATTTTRRWGDDHENDDDVICSAVSVRICRRPPHPTHSSSSGSASPLAHLMGWPPASPRPRRVVDIAGRAHQSMAQ
eukprot:1064535-Pyramimonas_sp.AAC.1